MLIDRAGPRNPGKATIFSHVMHAIHYKDSPSLASKANFINYADLRSFSGLFLARINKNKNKTKKNNLPLHPAPAPSLPAAKPASPSTGGHYSIFHLPIFICLFSFAYFHLPSNAAIQSSSKCALLHSTAFYLSVKINQYLLPMVIQFFKLKAARHFRSNALNHYELRYFSLRRVNILFLISNFL
jgi:hypothetical protein